jgi:hypothetical protein
VLESKADMRKRGQTSSDNCEEPALTRRSPWPPTVCLAPRCPICGRQLRRINRSVYYCRHGLISRHSRERFTGTAPTMPVRKCDSTISVVQRSTSALPSGSLPGTSMQYPSRYLTYLTN